jgi:hypothetical protein
MIELDKELHEKELEIHDLLLEISDLSDKYGPNSKQVDDFAIAHNDNEDFLEAAALLLHAKDKVVEGSFEKELKKLINVYSRENVSDTPDYILAEYMNSCLIAFNVAVKRREVHYGRKTESVREISLTKKE